MEITLSPEDNLKLANLCGALDENIKQIADALEVNIVRRGAHFKLSGTMHNTRLAAQLLENFYTRAKKMCIRDRGGLCNPIKSLLPMRCFLSTSIEPLNTNLPLSIICT